MRMPRTSGRASSSAVRKIGSVRSVGSGSVRWRVIVRNDESRILTVTVDALTPRVAEPARRRPRPCRGASARSPRGRTCRRRTCARGRPTSPRRRRRPGPRRARAPGRRATPRACRSVASSRSAGSAARSPIVRTPYSRSAAAVFAPTPHSRRDRQRREERRLRRRAGRRPGRRACAGPTRSWRRAWSAATPTETVSPTSSRTAALICAGDRLAVAEQRPRAGHVEERLVDRDRLDERREPPQDRHDLAADAAGTCAPSTGRKIAVRAEPRRPSEAASPSGRRTRGPRSSRC